MLFSLHPAWLEPATLLVQSHILYPFALLMTLCFRRQPSDPAAFRSRLSVSARRKEVSTWIDRVQKSCGKIESVMTRFEDLTQSEQAAITQARVEAGKRPIPGYPLPTAYANAPNPFVSTITAQDFAPPAVSTFAQAVEAARCA